MIGRIIGLAALAGVGVLTTALQFDLKVRSAPQFAAVVPEPLRDYAQVKVVQKALNGSNTRAALAEAQTLVQRRPLPAEYLTLLAAAQEKAGQRQAAAKTIQIAGQRGWRDPVAQLAVLRLALAAGDRPEAARRYAALFVRGETPDALLEQFGPAPFDATDTTGRDTMVAIVVGGQRWHSTFLRRGPRVMPPAAYSEVAVESMRKGAAFNCKVLEQSLRELRLRDRAAAEPIVAAASDRCPLSAQG